MRDRLLAALALTLLALGASAGGARGNGQGSGQDVVLTLSDPAIVEASALVVQDGLFITSNDSGDTGRVFAVDRRGRTVGVTHWSDSPTDVEALAPGGHGTVWVGDIGDNTHHRDAISIARIPVGRGDRTVRPQTYRLTDPGGAGRDAETLVRDPRTGRLYVIDKSVFAGTVYAVPRHLTTAHAQPLKAVGTVLSLATDGAFFPDGRHLVVRDYAGAIVYRWPSLEVVGSFRLPDEPQGEGIAVASDDRVYVSSEGVDSHVLRVPLPPDVRQAVEAPVPVKTTPSESPSSSPRRSSGSSVEEPVAGDPAAWLVSGLVIVVAIGVLLAALRPR